MIKLAFQTRHAYVPGLSASTKSSYFDETESKEHRVMPAALPSTVIENPYWVIAPEHPDVLNVCSSPP